MIEWFLRLIISAAKAETARQQRCEIGPATDLWLERKYGKRLLYEREQSDESFRAWCG